MSSARGSVPSVSSVAVAATVVVAVAVIGAQYAVSARAVTGPAPDLSVLVLAPIVPGAVAVAAARSRSATSLVVLAILVTTLYGTFLAGAAGDARASREAAAREHDDACNTSSSGLSVPFGVDAAFRAVGRVEEHHLHGPAAGGADGCTMRVAGDPDRAFGEWRRRLVGSGWRVERDDAEVVVARRGVRLTLFVHAGSAYLNAAAVGADDCAAGRVLPDATRTDAPEVQIASGPCS